MQQETVIVLDFGGQYNQLIARRVRECNVYCEIYSYRTDLAKIKAKNPKGIIFTGGPNSAYLPDSPTIDPEIYIRFPARMLLIRTNSLTVCNYIASTRKSQPLKIKKTGDIQKRNRSR